MADERSERQGEPQRPRFRISAGWAGIALVLVACAGLLALPLQGLALIIAQGLTTTLIDLGDGWLAMMISPINSIASIVVVSVKAIRMGRSKLRSLSYAT